MADTEPLTAILAEIADLDECIAGNDQRIAQIKDNSKNLRERRDKLCVRGMRAVSEAKIDASHFDGPNGTVWRRTGGVFERVPTIDASSIAVPVPATETMSASEQKMHDSVRAACDLMTRIAGKAEAADLLDRIAEADRANPWLRSCGEGVQVILGFLDAGMSCESLIRMHPGLTVEDIEACLLWQRMRATAEASN